MADLVRKSNLLQQFFNTSGKTKEEILKIIRKHPEVISAEYIEGTLVIKTTVDFSPLIIEVELKD